MPFGGQQGQSAIKVSEGPATVTFNFTAAMASSATILTQVVTATVYSGVDPNPAAVISGAATASGKVVSQNILGAVAGVIYQLLCVITTSDGKGYRQSSYLAVVPPLT